jgi:hypothetical protein
VRGDSGIAARQGLRIVRGTKRALCDLLFIDLLFMPPPEFRRQLGHRIFE